MTEPQNSEVEDAIKREFWRVQRDKFLGLAEQARMRGDEIGIQTCERKARHYTDLLRTPPMKMRPRKSNGAG